MYLEGLAEQFPSLKNGHCKHILSKEMFYDVPRSSPPITAPGYTGVSTLNCPWAPITRRAGWTPASLGRVL